MREFPLLHSALIHEAPMPVDAELLNRLRDRTFDVDQSGDWPADQMRWLAETGIMNWVIPREFGGEDVSAADLLDGYLDLSEACQTTAFILTQRNGACQRIAACPNEGLKARLLPALGKGELFATVGISHLTTSRQHWRTPAVSSELDGDEIRLSGNIPWVTGAKYADIIVTGGTCSDGQQVLVALPTSLPGVMVQDHARLMALTASFTASVELRDVRVPIDHLLAGPVREVMKQGVGGGTGSQVTSTLAAGLSRRCVRLLTEQAAVREELVEVAERFRSETETLCNDLLASVRSTESFPALPSLAAGELRQRANSLVLRITQAALAVSKGAGFVQGHPAELAVRESMFYLVWSCPAPVIHGMLEEFSCVAGGPE